MGTISCRALRMASGIALISIEQCLGLPGTAIIHMQSLELLWGRLWKAGIGLKGFVAVTQVVVSGPVAPVNYKYDFKAILQGFRMDGQLYE